MPHLKFFRYSTNMAKVAKAAACNISIICSTNLKDNLTKTPAGGGHRNHYLWHPVLADSRYVVTVCCLSEISARLINTATDTIRRRQRQLTHTHTHTPVKQPFVRDYPGEQVPER